VSAFANALVFRLNRPVTFCLYLFRLREELNQRVLDVELQDHAWQLSMLSTCFNDQQPRDSRNISDFQRKVGAALVFLLGPNYRYTYVCLW